MELNQIVIAGNLTKDPDLLSLPGGKTKCEFAIAANRGFKDAGGQRKEEVSFFDVECWGKTAEVAAKYLHKGRGVVVVGTIRQHRWEAPNNGGMRSKVYIVADNVQFMGPPKEGHQGQSMEGGSQVPPAEQVNFDT